MVLYGKGSLFPSICRISGSAVWGRGLSPGIRVGFADGAVWGRDLFSLAFVGDLPMVLYWKRLLFPGIFGIRHIRYRRGPPVVRNMHSVHENPLLCGTECVFRGSRCKKQASGVPSGNSVLKKGFWCTRRVSKIHIDGSGKNSYLA